MAGTDLQFDITALDRATKTFVAMGKAVERFEKQLDKVDGKRVDVEADVDTTKAERKLGKFATDARRDIEKALKALPDVEIDANSTPAQREVARLRGELAELNDLEIGVDIDATTAMGRAKAIREQLLEIERRSPYNAQVSTDVAAAAAALAAFSGEVEKVDGKKVKVKVETDKSLSDSLIHVTRLASALGTLALPAAAIAAAPQIAAIGSAALTATGALALLPAVATAGAVAAVALTMSFKGFGDAVGDNPKKAAEALAKLSPEAREAALAVRLLATDWAKVQQAVQDKTFNGVAEDLKLMSSSYLPAVSSELVRVAGGFNAAARDSAKFLTAKSVVKDLAGALEDAGTGATNATGAVEPLVRAVVDLVAVGSTRLPRLGQGFADAAEDAAHFIDVARESGQLDEWIDEGIAAVQQLGRISVDVGGSLGAIFKASDEAGASFLDTVEKITDGVHRFLDSAEGQSALVSLFTEIRDGVDAAAPGVERIALAIARVIDEAGDAGVLQAAGEAFSDIAEEVGPLIEDLGGLAPILVALLNTAGALAPVLVPVAAGLLAMKAASTGMDKLSSLPGVLAGVGASGKAAADNTRDLPTVIGGVGNSAKDADGKVGGLSGKVSGLAGASKNLAMSVGPVGWLAAIFAVDAATNNGISDLLNHIAGFPDAAARAKEGIGPDFWSQLFQTPAARPNDRWDVRNIGKTMSDALLDTQRQLSGFQLEPITLAIEADSTAASISATDLMNEINGSEATVNINGNEVPAGFALRQVISDINAGKGEVIIDGKPMPAQDALQHVIDTINAGAGMVEINGEAKPAGEVLRDLLNRANTPGQATVPIGGDKAGFDESLRDGVGAALATNAMIPISGDPNDFQGIVNNLVAGVNATAGTININGNPMPAGDALNSVLQAINTGQGTVTINGEEMNVVDALYRVTQQIDSTTGTVLINGNQVPASEALQQAITSINAGQGTVRINGDDVPVGQVLTALGGKISAVSGTVSINGNPQPANTALATVISLINGGAGSVTINGVTMPAQGALASILGQVNAGSGTITVNGQSAPAQTVLQSVIAAVNSGSGTITVNGQSVPADQALAALVGRINGSSGTVTANANTGAAASAINSLTTPRTVTIRAVVQADYANAQLNRMAHGGAGGGLVGYAGGGVVPQRFARGGVLPGYGPGRDTVPAILSAGEAVLVPELVRALGPANIIAANRLASGRKATMWSASGRPRALPAGGSAREIPERLSAILGQVRAAVGTPRGGAPAGGIQLGPLLALLQQQVGQTRALRGDVMSAGQWSQLISAVQSLAASGVGNPAATTGAARSLTETGAF